ncbi:MAG: hypothetical protein DRP00_04365 [Candidatus Aenigmatarchaeota archaeon]|nr:MAG: hypothetical protein DRP00_04365 [Candidatus Aenigmarchaeota archaeon]
MSSKKRKSPWIPVFIRDCTKPTRCDRCNEFIPEQHLIFFLPTIPGRRPKGSVYCRNCFIEWIDGLELAKVL